MNHALAAVGDPEANLWADRVRQRFRRDSLLCDEYNNRLADGKWRGMMIQKHIGYTSWNDDFPADRLPSLKHVAAAPADGYTFRDGNRLGYLSMDADHYAKAVSSEGTAWTAYPDMGRTRSAIALTPYTLPVDGASLTYRMLLPDDVREVSVHVVVKSTLDFLNQGGHEYEVSLDGFPSERVNFNARLNEAPENIHSVYYPTVARRVVENTVKLPVSRRNIHELTLRPLAPGIVFEKIVVDYGGYRPQYLFGAESDRLPKE